MGFYKDLNLKIESDIMNLPRNSSNSKLLTLVNLLYLTKNTSKIELIIRMSLL